MEPQVTITQLYAGFIGLKESQISSHPLGKFLQRMGSQPLTNNMNSVFYVISQTQHFLLIVENGLIVGQQTVWPGQDMHYEQLRRQSLKCDNSGFYIDTPLCKNIYIQKKIGIGEPSSIVASMY